MEREAAADSSKDVIASQNMATKDLVIIEIPEDTIEGKKWSKCEIFRAPRMLRDSREKFYTPQLVSIGPFHYGRKELKGMESHKEKYLEEFYKRTGGISKKDVILCVIGPQSNEKLASYAGTIEVVVLENFAEIIHRDACFILELFCRQADYKKKEIYEGDYIFKTPWLRNAVMMDLILLENQLPFNFLEEIYDFVQPKVTKIRKNGNPEPDPASSSTPLISDEGRASRPTFKELAINFFIEYSSWKFDEDKEIEDVIGGIKEIKHFTDLVRQFWLPLTLRRHRDPYTKPKENYLYSAKQLHKAGVSFAPAKKTDKSESGMADFKLDEKCCKCIPFPCCPQIKLPLLTLDGKTELLMRNVMALEQCIYPDQTFICNYVSLMSELMKTEEDVDFLVEKKIVKNLLGSNREAATLLNELCDDITEQSFIYADKCKDLNNFYENVFNKTRGLIKRVYFKDLWTASTSIVGLCVFIFTVWATVKSLFFS